MDNKTVFVKTRKGEDEIRGKTANLYSDIKRALMMIDGSSTLGEISKRAVPSLRRTLDEMIKELAVGGFIQGQNKGAKLPDLVSPSGMHSTIKKPVVAGSELDFTNLLAAEADKLIAGELRVEADSASGVRTEVEVKAKKKHEAGKLKEQELAATARAELETKNPRAKADVEARQEYEAGKSREKLLAAARLQVGQENDAKAEANAKTKQDIEVERLKAQQATKAKTIAEIETRKAKIEVDRRTNQAIDAERLREQQQAAVARARAELEATRAKALAEANAYALAEEQAKQEAETLRSNMELKAKARAEAEAKARQDIEAAKVKEQQQAAVARARAELEATKANADADVKQKQEEAEALRIKAEAEAKENAEVEAKQEIEVARLKAHQAAEAERLKAEQSLAADSAEPGKEKPLSKSIKSKSVIDPAGRSTSATVLFFDVVGYTKHSVNKQIEVKKQFTKLVSDCLAALGQDERIILDTGDGAAIGFLQHPEDALEAAMQFRNAVMSGQDQSYADLKVRIGIHLGPINIVKDMNGQSNMVGDGINDAQRVMGFAGVNQIFISRPYYDFISRLSDEYAELFQYRGSQKDKHGREHPVYELVDAVAPAVEMTSQRYDEAVPAPKLEPFSLAIPTAEISPLPAEVYAESEMSLPEDVPSMIEHSNASKHVPVAKSPEVTGRVSPVERTHSDDEARQLEGNQARVWADAQQRALEVAKENAKRALQSQQFMATATQNVATTRVRRKPIPWGKVVTGLFVVLVIGMFAVPYFMPMQSYLSGIEKLLSGKLQQPVHVANMSSRLLPTPRLELVDVSIGATKQVQAQHAQVNFGFLSLFGETKAIDSVELKGVQVNGAVLPQVSSWFRQLAADVRHPISRIGLRDVVLQTEGIQLNDISGTLSFDQSGKFVGAKLLAAANKYSLDINTSSDDKNQVSFSVRDGVLPFLPNWVFDELNVRGVLSEDALQINELDGRIMGGMMTGNARISWRSGWRAQGSLTAQAITLQKLSLALGGDMDGTAQFQMQSDDLPSLAGTASMEGDFTVKKGVINGMDIVETARLRSRTSPPGGRTYFDELNGEFSGTKDHYAVRQFRMKTGVLAARGTLDISKLQLSGNINADMAASTGLGSITLQVSGTSDNPTLHLSR